MLAWGAPIAGMFFHLLSPICFITPRTHCDFRSSPGPYAVGRIPVSRDTFSNVGRQLLYTLRIFSFSSKAPPTEIFSLYLNRSHQTETFL